MAGARGAPLLRGDRAARRAARAHGRPRRAPDRRRAARAQGPAPARRDALRAARRARPLADHERLPAAPPAAGPRRRRPQAASTCRWTRWRADRFFELTRRDALQQVLDGLEAAERHPELRPIKVNAVALRDFTEDEVAALRRARAPQALRGALHRVHAARRRPRLGPRPRAAQRRGARGIIHAVYPLEPLGRPRARHRAALPLRRRPGRDRLHLPRVASRSAATATASASPPTGGCAPACSRSNETDLRAPLRAGASDDELEAIVRDAVWARSSSTTSTSPGSCSPRARCRRSAAEPAPLARGGVGAHRAARRARCQPETLRARATRSAACSPPTRRAASTCRRSTARRWTATRSAPPTPRPAPLASRARWRPATSRRARSRPARRVGITTGGALPPGADASPSEDVDVLDGTVSADHGARRAGPPRALPRRGRARAATCSCPPASGGIAAGATVARRGRASAPSPSAAARASPSSSRATSCSRRARRPARAASTRPTASCCACSPSARAPRSIDLGARPDERARDRRRRSSAASARDVLLVSGGVSVGEHDHVKAGPRRSRRRGALLARARSSPASRCASAGAARRSCSACPGNPLSGVVCFLVFVEPLLRRMHGEADAAPRLRARPPRGARARPRTAARRFLTARLDARRRTDAARDADRAARART